MPFASKSNLPPISLTTHLIFHIRYVSCVEYNACVCLEERITGIGQKFVEKFHFSVTTLCARTLLLPNAWWLLSLNLAPLFFLSWFDLNIKGGKEWFIVCVVGSNTSCVLLDCWRSILLSSLWHADTAENENNNQSWIASYYSGIVEPNHKRGNYWCALYMLYSNMHCACRIVIVVSWRATLFVLTLQHKCQQSISICLFLYWHGWNNKALLLVPFGGVKNDMMCIQWKWHSVMLCS